MIVQNIKITGFRNLQNLQVAFCEKKNLIHGVNGAGKTSILEAIFLLGFGKSFLNAKKNEIINDKNSEFILQLTVTNPTGNQNTINAHFKNNLTLLLNGKKSHIAEINHYLYPIIFSSANYNLYIESKTHIRKLVDRFIFGLEALYINHLLSYNKALKQKNFLLKNRKNLEEISSWNKLMSEMAEKITGIRINFIAQLNHEINRRFAKDLTIRYMPSFQTYIHPNDANSANSANSNHHPTLSAQFFFQQIEKRKHHEIQFKRSLVGTHLDNFEILLNRKNLKFYSSGEKKIHLLMIYIAFIELFKKIKNDYPVFLVDDFDTAIDAHNLQFLDQNYPLLQVIATSVNQNPSFDRSIELTKEI